MGAGTMTDTIPPPPPGYVLQPPQADTMAATHPAGLIAPGNIDLSKRPIVRNADGSYSTVRSISIDQDGHSYLIPTVVGDRVVSNDDAIKHFQQTGENLGQFKTWQDADAYAKTLHDQQAAEYDQQAAGTQSSPPAGHAMEQAPGAAATIPPPPPGYVLQQGQSSAAVPDYGDQWTPAQKALAAREAANGQALMNPPQGGDLLANIKNAYQAMGHHLANLPLGLSQLVGHGITSAADAVLPADSSIRQRINATGSNFDANMRARESAYQAEVPTNAGTLTGAAVGEIAPWALGIGELRAAGLIPEATKTLGKLGTLAAEGGAMGLAQPVTGNGGYAGQKAMQVGIGAATGPVLYGASKLASGVKGVVQHVANPQAVADANIANLFGATPGVIDRLRYAPNYVPGEVPSAAQALATPEAVQAERMLRTNPISGPAFVHADNANNAARQSVVRQLAGNDATMQAAKTARRQAVQPFTQQSLSDSYPISRWTPARNILKTVVDNPGRMPTADFDALKAAQGIASKVRGGSMQEDDALQALQELGDSVTTKTAQDVFARVHAAINRNMVDPSGILRAIATIRNGPLGVDPERGAALDAIMGSVSRAKNINGLVGTDMLDQVRQQAAKYLDNASDQSKLAYGPAIRQIVDAIDAVAPGYRDYLAAYAKHSEPINTMESVQKLLDPNAPGSLNAAGDPQLAISRLRQVLRGDDKARYPMSAQARAQLNQVLQSLLRRTISDNKIAPSGPGTAADLTAQSGLPSLVFGPAMGARGGVLPRLLGGAAGAALGSHFGPAGAAVGAGVAGGLGDALGAANRRVIGRVGATAANAQQTAAALERYLKLTQRPPSLINQLLLGSSPASLPSSLTSKLAKRP